MTITQARNVGIGTTSPASTLDIGNGLMTGNTRGFVDTNRSGFSIASETTISFNGVNTFTLAPTGSVWSYYRNGIKRFVTGSKTLVLSGSPVATGTYFIYIDADDGTLSQSTSAWTLLDSKIPVAVLIFNDTLTPKYQLLDERHTIGMDRRVHYYLHTTIGGRLSSAPALSGQTINTDTNVAKTCSIGASVLNDEDIIHANNAVADPDGTATPYVVFYRTGASSWAWKQSNMPFVYNVGNTNDWIQYDNAGTMTDLTGGAGALTRWVNSYLVVTNMEGSSEYVWVMGRNVYTDLVSAQEESPTSFDWTGFPISEAVIAYRLTWSTITSTSQGKCQLAVLPVALNASVTNTAGSGGSIAHDTLSGINLAGSGYTFGHVSDQAQTIAGAKTFSGLMTISGGMTITAGATFSGSLSVPNGSAPVVDASGEVAVDTTSDQFVFYGGAKRVLPYKQSKCFTIQTPADTDDNVPVMTLHPALTIVKMRCLTEGGTSVAINLSDGTNNTDSLTCTSSGVDDDGSIANATFTANERIEFDTGTPSGVVNWVNFCFDYSVDAD